MAELEIEIKTTVTENVTAMSEKEGLVLVT